jgi:hypothetical protein
MESDHKKEFHNILYTNSWFMKVLTTVRGCNLPDWFIGAGIIRNIVWDYLHKYTTRTPIDDIDVIFFDPNDLRKKRDQEVQQVLKGISPEVPWEATNQAAVHKWYEEAFGYKVEPLLSSEDAIGTWPETVTSIGIRLEKDNSLFVVAPFGLDDLFKIILRRNPRRVSLQQFRQRIIEKRIQEKWPMVTILDG